MMDAAKDFFTRALRKDNIAVMIQAHDGTQFIVDRNHFVTRQGKSIALKGHWETVIRAALRTIRYLDKKVTTDNFEIVKPRNLGSKRTHSIVWFPLENGFQADDTRWNGHLTPIAQEDSFTKTHLRRVKYDFAEAVRLREKRKNETSEMSILMEHQ